MFFLRGLYFGALYFRLLKKDCFLYLNEKYMTLSNELINEYSYELFDKLERQAKKKSN